MRTFLSGASLVLSIVALTSISLTGYAQGNAANGKSKAVICAACHGPDGNSTNPDWPSIAGQHASYIERQVKAIKAGIGRGPDAALMAPMVANMSGQDIADVAAYFESQSPVMGTARADSIAVGQKLFRGGNAASGVPACMSCHGPAGLGSGPAGFPAVAGQHARYTVKQLRAYRDGSRSTDQNSMMRTVAKRLSDEEITAVAQYMAGLH